MTPASTNTDTHALFKMMPRGFNKKKFSVSYQVVNNKNLQEILVQKYELEEKIEEAPKRIGTQEEALSRDQKEFIAKNAE